MKYYLGIDPATISAGYAVIDEKGALIDYGKTVKPKDMPEGEGYLFHYNKYVELIKQYDIAYIGCEDQYGGRNMDTLKKMSRMSGCVMMMAASHEIPIEIYAASQWRKVTHGPGNGGVDKAYTQEWVNRKYKKKFLKKENDITDAIGIAYAVYSEKHKKN